MDFPSLPLVVLDTETTGFIPRVNRIIEFASVRMENGKILDEYEQLISIPTEIPDIVQVLTRIQNDSIKDKPTFEDVRDEITNRIGTDVLIVGQNVGFDIRMLKGEGVDLSDYPWIDTSMLASLVFPELASYSLGYVSQVLNLNHEPVHRALGDVHATLELLGACWQRLCELPPELHDVLKNVMSKSSRGYQLLFDALPAPTAKNMPSWVAMPCPPTKADRPSPLEDVTLEKAETGTVQLIEEPLDPTTIEYFLKKARKDPSVRHWITVKNLTAVLRRIVTTEDVRVLRPPFMLLDFSAAALLAGQQTYTAEEATLALKLAWYEPCNDMELPLHGDEKAVWNGKLACTDQSKEYLAQYDDLPSVVLLDHRQLLIILADENHPAHDKLHKDDHIVIDDASMLEDTASKAYGKYAALDDIRAAATGNEALTRFTDLLQIWVEKTRNAQDLHYLQKNDLESQEVKGVIERAEEVLSEGSQTKQIERQLSDIVSILRDTESSDKISWIEQRQNGTQFLRSVPESIGTLLQSHLYSHSATSLLVPPGSSKELHEILPAKTPITVSETDESLALPLMFDFETSLSQWMQSPPDGKTIMLIASRRNIEDSFVQYTTLLEEKGVTLICQGLSGGQGRMQAEFTAAGSPCLWLLTPWTYEGIELNEGSVDHLVLHTLPFDHPADPILSKRSMHYQNAFMGYTLPRLKHRLFRLLRTYSRHRTESGDVTILDKRIVEKRYGENIKQYMNGFALQEETPPSPPPPPKKKVVQKKEPKKSAKPDSDDEQLALF